VADSLLADPRAGGRECGPERYGRGNCAISTGSTLPGKSRSPCNTRIPPAVVPSARQPRHPQPLDHPRRIGGVGEGQAGEVVFDRIGGVDRQPLGPDGARRLGLTKVTKAEARQPRDRSVVGISPMRSRKVWVAISCWPDSR